MKLLALALLSILLLPTALAGESVCRSVSTSWESGGHAWQTRMSTEAKGGCKRIWQSRDGVETEGVDCNCDLVVDGMEGHFQQPGTARQARRLIDTCRGPETVPGVETEGIVVRDQLADSE